MQRSLSCLSRLLLLTKSAASGPFRGTFRGILYKREEAQMIVGGGQP